MFRLFCKHQYKYYNRKIVSDYSSYYVFQFVCTKCGREFSISEIELQNKLEEYLESYNRHLALGNVTKTPKSQLSFSRKGNFGVIYEGAYVTWLLEDYLKRGIDLTELSKE